MLNMYTCMRCSCDTMRQQNIMCPEFCFQSWLRRGKCEKCISLPVAGTGPHGVTWQDAVSTHQDVACSKDVAKVKDNGPLKPLRCLNCWTWPLRRLNRRPWLSLMACFGEGLWVDTSYVHLGVLEQYSTSVIALRAWCPGPRPQAC